MPDNTYPVPQPLMLTEEDMLRAQGIQVPQVQQPIQQTYQPYQPNAQDLQGMALQEQYAKAQQEALLAQQQGIEQYQKNIDDLRGRESQVDLTPLAALADAWGIDKSNFAASYKRPQSKEEKQAQIMSLQEKLQAQKDKQSDNRTSALKSAIEAFKATKDNKLNDEYKRSQIRVNDALANTRVGGRPLPEVSVQKLSDFEAGLSELSTVKENLIKNANVFGPVRGRMGSINPADVQAQSVQADINRARQVIGKAVEGGVLRKEDEVKYEKMLPVLSDEPQVAVHKMKQFEAKLSQDHNRYLNNMQRAGFNIKEVGAVQDVGPMQAAGRSQQAGPTTLSEEKMRRLQELRQKAQTGGE